MVSLYDAVKFTGRLDDDKNTPDEILTVKRLKETYGLRYTKVVRIAAYFGCED